MKRENFTSLREQLMLFLYVFNYEWYCKFNSCVFQFWMIEFGNVILSISWRLKKAEMHKKISPILSICIFTRSCSRTFELWQTFCWKFTAEQSSERIM